MILCLDVGNTHFYGGVFQEEKLLMQFRYPSTFDCTSDQLGVFLKGILRENDIDPNLIAYTSVSSVVPSLDYSIRACFLKYFSIEPLFLKIGLKTGLRILYKNPQEIGSDRIANAVAAAYQFPQKNIIVIDLGTATTFDIISSESIYLGGVIMPGINLAMKTLNENTAKLPPVTIVKSQSVIGQTTIANIQAGLFYGNLGAFNEIVGRITTEAFKNKEVIVIGTGGFSHLFEDEKIFTTIIPDLVLQGLRLVLKKNMSA